MRQPWATYAKLSIPDRWLWRGAGAGTLHPVADDPPPATGILIEFRADAGNELPGVLADLSEEYGHAREATAVRWDVVAAANRRVTLRRLAVLPAVPRLGEDIHLDPYPEVLRGEHVTWFVHPEVGEPHVSIQLGNIDFDVIGDDDDALDAFSGADWEIGLD